MEIVVLLKQVPSTETAIAVAGDGISIKTDDVNWVINPYDEFAVEEALKIKEALGGTVTVLTVGSEKASETVRMALAMGADQGILVTDTQQRTLESLPVARILAAVLQDMPFDVILAGQRAVDDDNFQVGPAVAEFLKLPLLSLVIQQDIQNGRIRCHQTIDGGTIISEAALPVLLTTQRGLNEPRFPAITGIMKARKKPLVQKDVADLNIPPELLENSYSRVIALRQPATARAATLIQAETPAAAAAELVQRLHTEARVI